MSKKGDEGPLSKGPWEGRQAKLKLVGCLLVPLVVLALPTAWIPLQGITGLEHRMLAIFLFAVAFWVFEPIPIFATSVAIIFAELLLLSDKGFRPLMGKAGQAEFGEPLRYESIMATFASPIIILFLGGFFLAMAATKYRLDANLARVFLRPFGSTPKMVMLGLMIITALFSMFMSNTATAAMMLAVLGPVLKEMPAQDRGRIGFALAVPFAANIGGIGTPIGTPPNAVAMKYLVGADAISFAGWMGFAVPYVLVMLLVAWLVLGRLFPSTSTEIRLSMKGEFVKSGQAITVYIVSAGTILLWLIGERWHGMSAHVVAMIPIAAFVSSGIISPVEMRGMSWDVLWLVSGGIALGLGLGETGLSARLVDALPFAELSVVVLIALAAALAWLMSTFMSNTATANLLLPIMAALGSSVLSSEDMGGPQGLIVVVAIACSLAMALPISTPPNALGHATGLVSTAHMARAGLIIGLLGMLALAAMLLMMQALGWRL